MTQYNPSLLIGQLKGSAGGTTFQGGNNSSVIKNKTYRKGKYSSARSSAAAKLVSVTTSWKSLSDVQRAQWEVAAGLWPFTNKFGVTYFSSGYQCYVAYNSNLLAAGFNPVSIPSPPITPVNLGPVSISALNRTQIILQNTIPGITNQNSVIYASPCYSPGRNTNNPTLKFLAAIDMKAISLMDVYGQYLSVYPSIVLGQRIIFKVIQLDEIYPYHYFPYTISGIVS